MNFFTSFINNVLNDISAVIGINIARVPSAIVIAVVCYFLYNFVENLFEKVMITAKIDKHLSNMIKTVFQIILFFIFIVIISSALGIDTTSIVAVFSLFGLAISLSIQNLVSNVAYAISILINKPYKDGDYIKINEYEGTVEEITFLNTKIKTINNEMIYVPNSTMGSNTIVNYTALPNRRIELIFDASYDDDIDRVKQVINEVVKDEPLTLKDKEIFVEVLEYSSSSIKYLVRVYCSRNDYITCKFNLIKNIKKKFDENNITIPFMTVNVNNLMKTD